jgi:hypothetical protein
MMSLDIGLITKYLPNGRQTKHNFRQDGSVRRCLYANDLSSGKNAALRHVYTQFVARNGTDEALRVRATVGDDHRNTVVKEYVVEQACAPAPSGWGKKVHDGYLDLRPVDAAAPAAAAPAVAPALVSGQAEASEPARKRRCLAAATIPASSVPFSVALAGYVYVVLATTRDLRKYWYVGSTSLLDDLYQRPRAHCDQAGSLLKRLPSSARNAVRTMELVEMKGVPTSSEHNDGTALNKAELDTTWRMIQAHGPERVRGASVLGMYDEPLSREHQMTMQHVYGLPY